jgi:RNA polymerase sigma-70 factor (ECF subfamily)
LKPLEEDRALLEAFRRGEPDALSAVFTQYGPGVAKILRHGFTFQSGGRNCRYRGARADFDLEDRLHDTFVRAFSERSRQSYDGLTPYDRYVAAIARNLVIDDFRKKENALVDYAYLDDVAVAVDDTSAIAPDKPKDAEAIVADKELGELVERFKASLKAREREVYDLRFDQGLLHKEIAERTGLSESKIKTSEQRIRKRFFGFMKKHGYFTGYAKSGRGWLRSLGVL